MNIQEVPKGSKRFEIWVEGYLATGESGLAHRVGISFGRTFKEACDLYAERNPRFKEFYDSERLTHWACRLYDNVRDARRFEEECIL